MRLERAFSQAMEVGVRALPVLSLITFFIGLILAIQGAYELRKFGATRFVADTVAFGMTRELGPLITAIVVIGRSGSAFAAEIGTMKVNEEIDALETMAISPVQFLVTPKFLAMVLMLPCLTIWANFMGIIGGSVFGMYGADFTWLGYMHASLNALFLRDITTGLIKSIMFGMTITAVGCFEGLGHRHGGGVRREIHHFGGGRVYFSGGGGGPGVHRAVLFHCQGLIFRKGSLACQRPSISPRP